MTEESKEKKCGLVMPLSAIDGTSEGHWQEVQQIIREALDGTGFKISMVSDANDVGIIQKRIVQNLYDNDVVICDVSAKNPNVMFELGMRLAFDKPAIIIKDEVTNYTFDAGQIEHLNYPRDLHYHSINTFKKKLRDKVLATYEASKKPEYTTFLKHFGQFVVAQIDEKSVGKEEYIFNVIAEMKGEMRAFMKNLRESQLSLLNPTGGYPIFPMPYFEAKTDRTPASEYLWKYIKSTENPELTTKRLRSKSNASELQEVARQFLEDRYGKDASNFKPALQDIMEYLNIELNGIKIIKGI